MKKTIGSVAGVVFAVASVVLLSAQARDADPLTSRELLNEIRALRAVIERFAAAQTQTQTIVSLMTAQQRRVAEPTTRVDIVRRELDAATLRYAEVSRRLAAADQLTPADMTGPVGAPPVDGRRALEEHRTQLRNEFDTISAQIAQMRARESEMLNQFAFEEGRWRELTSQMEEWLKK